MTRFILTSDLHYGFDYTNPPIIKAFLTDMKAEKPDVVMIAGDIISHDQSQWEMILPLLREAFPTQPILIVLGNHDWWQDGEQRTIFELQMAMARVFAKYDIQYLEREIFKVGDTTVFGFDGWYWSSTPPSNDMYHIPKLIQNIPFNDWLFAKAKTKLDEICERLPDCNNAIVMTHFEPNDDDMGAPSVWLELLRKNRPKGLMTFCCGHTHRKNVKDFDGIRYLNAGSDYNAPDYIVFDEIPKKKKSKEVLVRRRDGVERIFSPLED